jgi:hypothetical protein
MVDGFGAFTTALLQWWGGASSRIQLTHSFESAGSVSTLEPAEVKTRFQSLLSNSTCTATQWFVSPYVLRMRMIDEHTVGVEKLTLFASVFEDKFPIAAMREAETTRPLVRRVASLPGVKLVTWTTLTVINGCI